MDSGIELDKETIEICKKVDINFDDKAKDVELTDEVKSKLTEEEIEKLESAIRYQKVMVALKKKWEELDK